VTPTTWHVIGEFVDLDLDDDDVVDALTPQPGLVLQLSSTEGISTADASLEADSLEDAVGLLLEALDAAAPGVSLLGLVDPLVSISDIADDAGVTRQGVRNWALGTRQSGFPRALDVVGDGIRVWRLAELDAWLTDTLGLGSGRRYPSALFIAKFNDALHSPTPGEETEAWNEMLEVTEEFTATVIPEPRARPARAASERLHR